MKKLIVGVLCLPILFVLSSLFAHSVLADACIEATCYSTIQEAVDVAITTDVINVQNGTYIDPVTISKQVTIIGEDKDLTVVQTGTTNIGFSLLTGADNVVIKNLKFTGNGEGINANDISNLTLQDLVISDNFLTTSGVYLFNVNTVNITGSTFSNNIIDIDIVDSTNNLSISNTTFNGGGSTTYYISNDTSNDVTATDNNSWGTFDGNAIDALLYDKKDDGALGRVIFDNTVPTVDAGTDKVVNTGFTQDANGTDTYGVSSYLWEQISGPGIASFDDPAIEDPMITADTEGTYELQLSVTDTSGNTGLDKFKLIWDKTSPSGSWVNPLNNDTISGTASLSVSTSDSLSGVDTVVYKYALDGSSTFTAIPGTTWDTTLLALGKYTLRAVITDNAGNIYNADESVYVAAVITSFSHFTVDTNRIQIDWTTDRPTDGKVVYDLNGHSNIGDYAFSTGTLDYGTTHSMIIAGLSDNTYYYFRAVSAGTPIVISTQGWNKTFTVAGAGTSASNQTPTSSSTPIPTPTPTLIVEQGEVEGVAIEIEVFEPTPKVEDPVIELPSFNWWLVIIPSPFLLGFLLWLARRLRN